MTFACGIVVTSARAQGSGFAGSVAASSDSLRRVDFETAMRLFRENNLRLRGIRARVREAASRVQQARAFPNPTLQVTHEPIWQGDQTQSESYVNLSQQVAWIGRSSRVDAARREADAARWKAAADRAEIARDVATTYLDAAAASERRTRIRRVTDVFRQADSSFSAREDAGDASGYAVRRMRLERARSEGRLAVAGLDAEDATRRLALLILPDDVPAVEAQSLPDGVPPYIAESEAVRVALRNRPELKQWSDAVAARRASVTASRRSTWPEPTVTAGYKRQSDGFEGAFFGLAIPLPVFHRKRGDVGVARAQLDAVESERIRVERTVQNEVRRAHSAYASARRQHALVAADLLSESGDLLYIARVSYAEGEMSLVELLDAADAYRDAQVRRIHLQHTLWTRYVRLLHAMGRPLTLP